MLVHGFADDQLHLAAVRSARTVQDFLNGEPESEGSEPVATRLLSNIKSSFIRLCKFPHSGAPREHFAKDLRVAFHGNYAIYHLSTKDELIVVLHGARDAATLATQGGFAL